MQAQEFYTDIIAREEEIAAAKAEMKEAMEAFAASNGLTVKGIQKGIKEYKQFLKDQAEYTMVDADADKVFEALTA